MKTHSLFLILTAARLCAQDIYTLDWSSITGGGLTTNAGGGEFTVESSIGQWGATGANGAPAGEFSITGGYWTFTLDEPLDLGLAMQINGGTVSLTWDDSTGIPVVLESSTDLQLWAPVNPQPQHPPFLEPTGQRRYYRLNRAP